MTSCTDVAPLFVQRELGVLEEEELDRLESHLDDCKTCPALTARLEGELVAAQVPRETAPEDAWDRLADALSRAEDATPLPIRIGLGCTYCHGRVVPESSVYCAACLAPHHGACFEEHGSCCAPGCDETRVVTRREAPTPPAASPNRKGVSWPVVLGLVLGAGVGAAALTQRLHQREVGAASAPTPPPAPTTTAHHPTYEGKTAEEWIEVLRDHSVELRGKARQALVALGDGAAGAPLRRVLRGDDFILAWRVRSVLLELNEREPIPLALYRTALAHPKAEFRFEAYDDLVIHRSPQAATLLARGLRDTSDLTRRRAATKLLLRGQLLSAAAQAEVEQALRDPRPEVRLLAAQTLAGAVTPATPALVRALDDTDPAVRRAALNALVNVVVDRELPKALGPAETLTTRLIRIVRRDSDEGTRAAAADLLAALDPSVPLEAAALAPALGDPAPRVRLEVARALAARGLASAEAVARLTELVGDEKYADAAIRTLARYGTAARPAVPTLIEGLGRSKRVHPSAVGATLAAAQVPFSQLEALLNASASKQREAGLIAACRRADRYLAHADALARSGLAALDGDLRHAGAQLLCAMARLDPKAVAKSILEICRRLNDTDRPFHAGVYEPLLFAVAHAAALDPWPGANQTFATALGHKAPWTAVRVLGQVFRGRPAAVAAVTPTLKSLVVQGAPSAQLPAACALLTLGQADAGATARVERALRFGNSVERRHAVHAVGVSRHPRKIALISERLADRDRSVRAAAARRLTQAPKLTTETLGLLRRRLELETDDDAIEALAKAIARHHDTRALPILRKIYRTRMDQTSGSVLVFDEDIAYQRVIDPMVRLGARDPELLRHLRRSLDDQGGVRAAVTLALAGEPLGLRALRRRLAHVDPDQRRRACEGLVELGPRAAALRDAVRALTKDPWPRVRRAAAAALKAIGG